MQSKKITDNLILQSEIYIKRDALDEAEKEIAITAVIISNTV